MLRSHLPQADFTMEQQTDIRAARPAIHMTALECDALFSLALSAEHRNPQAAAMLMAELDRAEIHDAANLPEQTVVMNAQIEFVDEGTGTRRTVTLVYPPDADIAAGRVSILTPVGTGLIGMTAGTSMPWPDRNGHERLLRIVSVTPPSNSVSVSA